MTILFGVVRTPLSLLLILSPLCSTNVSARGLGENCDRSRSLLGACEIDPASGNEYACHNIGGYDQCARALKAGDRCGFEEGVCEIGLECLGEFCETAPTLGEACTNVNVGLAYSNAEACGNNSVCFCGESPSEICPLGTCTSLKGYRGSTQVFDCPPNWFKGHQFCLPDHRCIFEFIRNDEYYGACIPRSNIGESCDYTHHCVQDARCRGGVCASLANEGDTCSGDLDCTGNLMCNTVCQPRSGAAPILTTSTNSPPTTPTSVVIAPTSSLVEPSPPANSPGSTEDRVPFYQLPLFLWGVGSVFVFVIGLILVVITVRKCTSKKRTSKESTLKESKFPLLNFKKTTPQFDRPTRLPASGEILSAKIYLIHRGPDSKRRIAEPLHAMLTKHKVNCFLDIHSMEIGRTNVDSMQHGLYACELAVIIFSRHFLESEWCVKEANTIFSRNVPFLPCIYGIELNEDSPFKPYFGQRMNGVTTEAHRSDWNFCGSVARRVLQARGMEVDETMLRSSFDKCLTEQQAV